MRNTVSRAKRGLLALSPLALLISLTVSAEISSSAREGMRRDLGMSDAQISQYLEIEALEKQHGPVAKAKDRGFAGSWIESKPDGSHRLVIASTSNVPKAAAAGIEYRSAKYSLTHLDAAKAALDATSGNAPAGVYGWGVDVRSNAVRVDVAPGAQRAAIDFVAASGADAGTIRFETMESAPRQLATFYGGSEYLSRSGGSYYYCSVGFNVTNGSARGFMTAGHCGNVNDTVHTLVNRRTVSSAIGSFKMSTYPNNGDGAYVELTGTHTLYGYVDGYNQADVPVRGSAVAAIGAIVCRSGRTTGYHCGKVEAYDNTVNYPDVSVSGLTRVKVCAEGGDSGGSFIDGGGQAQGMLSGGNYSCKGNQASLATSYFQPINDVLGSRTLILAP